MEILIINGHLYPHESYTQRFFYESIRDVPNVTMVELSQTPHFNGEELKKYDRIFFQFPIYWYSVPGLMKQWMDDNLKSSFHFLKGKEFGVIAFFGTTQHKYKAGESEQFTIEEMCRPFQMLANYFGMTYLPILSIHQFAYCTQEQKDNWLVTYQQHVLLPKNATFEQLGYWYIEQLQQINGSEHIIDYLKQKLDDLEQVKLVAQEMDDE